jgi:hypothetical protein
MRYELADYEWGRPQTRAYPIRYRGGRAVSLLDEREEPEVGFLTGFLV